MAPINFEDNIRQKLEKRNIEPSAQAWGKLSQKLDDQEGRSNSKFIWWIGIAASLVGVFLVSTLFFNKNESEVVTPEVVVTPNNDQEILPEINSESIVSKKTENGPFVQKENTNEPIYYNVVNKESNKVKKSIQKNTILASNNNVDQTLQEQKINKVLESVNLNKNEESIANSVVENQEYQVMIESEIDLLLKHAKQDLTSKNNKSENIVTVDANSLLEEVETDLDQSFRDKIFETILSGYNTVKTAVAERND